MRISVSQLKDMILKLPSAYAARERHVRMHVAEPMPVLVPSYLYSRESLIETRVWEMTFIRDRAETPDEAPVQWFLEMPTVERAKRKLSDLDILKFAASQHFDGMFVKITNNGKVEETDTLTFLGKQLLQFARDIERAV